MTSTLSTDSRPKPLRQCALGRPAINNQSIEIDVSIAAEVGVLPIFAGSAGVPIEGPVVQPIVDATRPIRVKSSHGLHRQLR